MQDPNTEKEYLKLLEEKRDYLRSIYPLESNNWLPETSNESVTIHSMYDEKSGLKLIRAQGKIRAPKEKVVEYAEEVIIVLEWDKTLEDVKLIYKSENYHIFYTLIKKLPLIVQRDAILIAKFFHESDGTILGAGTSIDHSSIEKSIYRVRATAYLVGWVMKTNPSDPEYTDFTLILHVNPEGWIPKAAFNWFAYTQGFNIPDFGQYVEKRFKREKEEKEKREKSPEKTK